MRRAKVTPETYRALVERSAGLCEFCGDPLGTSLTTMGEAHHRQLRRHGDHTLGNLVLVHKRCHDWAHQHPFWAKGLGWIVPSWDVPAQVPVTKGKPWEEK